MLPRPVIFVSAVSQELRSARDLIARELQKLGYEPVWQEIFGTEAGDIRQMLREKIQPCAGVLQLLGHRYGFAPPAPDGDFGRVSYTQFEALHVRQQGKKVWYLLLDPAFPTDPVPDEPADLRDLQLAYRQRVEADTHVYHGIANLDSLRATVRGMRDDLALLRAEWERWSSAIEKGVGQTLQTLTHLEHTLTDPALLRAKLEEKIDESFEEKRQQLLAAKAPPLEIDALYRQRDRAKGPVAEAVAFISARAADSRSPIITRAAAILEERGVDATLEFLDHQLQERRQRRREEGRQLAEASMMKAGLHQYPAGDRRAGARHPRRPRRRARLVVAAQ